MGERNKGNGVIDAQRSVDHAQRGRGAEEDCKWIIHELRTN
jgi:hypothetical protein